MKEIKHKVFGRGIPPDSFLEELIAWGRSASLSLFSENDEKWDVMSKIKPILAPQGWNGIVHRRAAMIELLRVLAGFESSWNWNEGVDKTNKTSMSIIAGRETGIFQVSFDSIGLDKGGLTLRNCIVANCHTAHPEVESFLREMKSNHAFAMEYATKLLRIDYRWDGPIKRGEINSSLHIPAVNEFIDLL